jgi:hypothetical protein
MRRATWTFGVVTALAIGLAVTHGAGPSPAATTLAASRTPAKSPSGHIMAPGCPPPPAQLDLATATASFGAKGSSFPGQAGADLRIPLTIPKALPDRQVSHVDVLLMPSAAIDDAKGSIDAALIGKYQLGRTSTVQAADSSPVADIAIPADAAAGSYAIMTISHWPMPSLCGHTNPAGASEEGTSILVIGSVVVP